MLSEEQQKKIDYVAKVMDLKGDTRNKKHGYYKSLTVNHFELTWDSYNDTHYLKHAGVPIAIKDFIETLYRETLDLYKLPSEFPLAEDFLIKFLDRLYFKDEKVREIINSLLT